MSFDETLHLWGRTRIGSPDSGSEVRTAWGGSLFSSDRREGADLFVTYPWGKPQPARRVECGGGKDPPGIRHRKDQPGALERKKWLPP